jgi:tRNA-dihydrouridine synthase A
MSGRNQAMSTTRPHRFSIAPMMDWTDRHCRFFHRLMTRRALIYTEMITTLGGCDPQVLAECARIAADLGYDEINLNVGCPSDRVQGGRFGACLMAEPDLVAACVAAMKAAVSIPVTVKCRIGIDHQDPEVALDTITKAVVAAGVDALIVHARKAWLQGLSPKENREIPPLDYDRVHRLKRAWRNLDISLNGGVPSVDVARAELAHVDGVMMGRAAYQEPWRLLTVDREIFGDVQPYAAAKEAALALVPYIERELAEGTRLHSIVRHVHGLFHAVPGARAFRRHLATEAVKAGAGVQTFLDALALVPDHAPARDEIAAA